MYNLAVSHMAAIHRAIQNRDIYGKIVRRIVIIGSVFLKLFAE